MKLTFQQSWGSYSWNSWEFHSKLPALPVDCHWVRETWKSGKFSKIPGKMEKFSSAIVTGKNLPSYGIEFISLQKCQQNKLMQASSNWWLYIPCWLSWGGGWIISTASSSPSMYGVSFHWSYKIRFSWWRAKWLTKASVTSACKVFKNQIQDSDIVSLGHTSFIWQITENQFVSFCPI